MTGAQYVDVMVEIMPAEPEQTLSAHPVKAAVASVHPRPVRPGTVKKHPPGSAHIHTLTPEWPAHRVASTQAVKTSQPVQMAALSSSSPASFRQAQGVDQKSNRNVVRKHLEAFKYYPASARRRGIEGDVDVSFMLVHGGIAEHVELLKGSGYAVLDRAAITTVARAQPFPVENGQYRFHLRFRRL